MGDEAVLVPVGENADKYKGIIRLNDSATFIVSCLDTDTTREMVINKMANYYNATIEQINQAIDITLSKLREYSALVE